METKRKQKVIWWSHSNASNHGAAHGRAPRRVLRAVGPDTISAGYPDQRGIQSSLAQKSEGIANLAWHGTIKSHKMCELNTRSIDTRCIAIARIWFPVHWACARWKTLAMTKKIRVGFYSKILRKCRRAASDPAEILEMPIGICRHTT